VDLETLFAVEETTDFLADLVTDGLLQADSLYNRPAVRAHIRQEIGMAITDAMLDIQGIPTIGLEAGGA
jgi:hypothetical protein